MLLLPCKSCAPGPSQAVVAPDIKEAAVMEVNQSGHCALGGDGREHDAGTLGSSPSFSEPRSLHLSHKVNDTDLRQVVWEGMNEMVGSFPSMEKQDLTGSLRPGGVNIP